MTDQSTTERKRHPLDKPILRHLFWFIVLPYQITQHIASHQKEDKAS